ncbi:MAG: CDP-alcohol phosphatidyltransferase family protein [Phycisphaerae bacterium]|nr:CDP-alcohol phosphatidyltransferase family protein [Phycisphaerae bacterium]
MKWTIPNQLTVSRIFLAAVFFVLVGLYNPQGSCTAWLMGAGFVIYVVAGITDILDGYLARKWNQVSAFGRMVDPIVDKVMVVGAFMMLAGPDFLADSAGVTQQLPYWITGGMLTCVAPWMVVVIVAREFLISGVRAYSESQGKEFPATSSGKIKMILQCVAVGAIVFYLAWPSSIPYLTWLVALLVWLSVIVTVYSGVLYIFNARELFRSEK